MLGRKRSGNRISLIPRMPEHIETIYSWWDDPGFYPQWEPTTFDQYFERYEERAKDADWSLWTVVVNGDPAEPIDEEDGESYGPQIIGMTEMSDFARQTCFNSFLYLVPLARGHGHGTEAIQLRTSYGYEMLDLELMETTTEIENISAQHALERAGYRQTGTRPHAFRDNGVWQDLYLYAIIREWWEAARNQP